MTSITLSRRKLGFIRLISIGVSIPIKEHIMGKRQTIRKYYKKLRSATVETLRVQTWKLIVIVQNGIADPSHRFDCDAGERGPKFRKSKAAYLWLCVQQQALPSPS